MSAKTKRVNITISEEMINFYQDLSEEMGISRSAVMVMAMKVYMDQQKSLKMGNMVDEINKLMEMLDKDKDLN